MHHQCQRTNKRRIRSEAPHYTFAKTWQKNNHGTTTLTTPNNSPSANPAAKIFALINSMKIAAYTTAMPYNEQTSLRPIRFAYWAEVQDHAPLTDHWSINRWSSAQLLPNYSAELREPLEDALPNIKNGTGTNAHNHNLQSKHITHRH